MSTCKTKHITGKLHLVSIHNELTRDLQFSPDMDLIKCMCSTPVASKIEILIIAN